MLITIIILSIMLIISLFYLIKFAIIVIKVQDAIERSLEELDDSYKNVSSLMKTSVVYDSSEVRLLLNEIEKTINVILKIANILTTSIDEKAIVDDEEN